ncbi:hypothetical protein [Streptococcus suis]|uniref:hypothetical protein n=1 Tax=Streptococcus suis TaxID=1307 RepID=UPI000C19FE1E|nr:hypothetical protein [Streptococcus suis]
MLSLIRRLVSDYIKTFIYVYLVGLTLRITANVFDELEVLRAINGIWIMISSVLLIILSTYFLHEFLYTRHKYFYYTIKYSRLIIFLIIAIILTLLNFIYYLIYADLNLWNGIQKLASLLVYFGTTSALLYGYRGVASKKLGSNIYLFTIVSLLVAHALIFYNAFSEQIGKKFMIGVSSMIDARNIYTNIVPITLFVENSTYVELSYYSLGANVLFFIIASVLLLILRKVKINW